MASKLKQLQDRQTAIVAAMRGVSDKAAEDDGRQLTEEEQAEYGKYEAELADTKTSLAREQHLQELERAMIPSGPTPATPTATPVQGDPTPAEPKQWDTFGELLQGVAFAATNPANLWDERLRQAAPAGLNEGVASQGGFLVQTDFSNELLRRAYSSNQVLNGGAGYGGVRKIPIGPNSNGVKINAVNETSRADGSRWGGVRAYWIEEAGTKDDTKPDFRQIELNLKKLVGLCYATDELLQDAAALEAVLMQAFADEFGFKIQDSLINGTGAGVPLGILNAGVLINQAKETGQAATTIVKENIDKMWSRMWPQGISNSVWLINQQCYPQLFSLSQSVGTGGLPVYLPPGGLSQSPYGTLLGRPVVPIEQCQALGTKGDIYFADWSQYLWCDKGGMKSDSSIHVKFTSDETTFRFVYRADGQPAWASPTTPFKGGATATTGPFVTLATRS